MEEIDISEYTYEDLQKIVYNHISRIQKNQEKLEKIWEQITELSSKENLSPGLLSKLQSRRMQAIMIESRTEKLFHIIDQLNEVREVKQEISKFDGKQKGEFSFEEAEEIAGLKATLNTLSIEIEEDNEEELTLVMSGKELPEDEDYEIEDIIISDEEDKNDKKIDENGAEEKDKKKFEISEEEMEKFLLNIDEEFDKFIINNTKMLKENDENIEKCYISFSDSLERRTEVIDLQLEKIKKYKLNSDDISKLEEEEKKLKQQQEDIENDHKVLDKWLEKKKDIDDGIQKSREKAKENREIRKKIKKLNKFINNPSNKDKKEEIDNKRQEIKELIKKKKENYTEINKINKENKKLLDEISNMSKEFKTVDDNLLEKYDDKDKKEVIKQSEKEETDENLVNNKKIKDDNDTKKENVSKENDKEIKKDVEAKDMNSGKKEEKKEDKKVQPVMPTKNVVPQSTVSYSQPSYQEQISENDSSVVEEINDLPQKSYMEILNEYMSEGKDTKSEKFLEKNFSTVMLALNDALTKGKLNGFKRDKLKAHIDLHGTVIKSKMKDCSPEKFVYIIKTLYSDDPEKLNKYTHYNEKEQVTELNDGIFKSVYGIHGANKEVSLKDLSKMNSEASELINGLFMKYHLKLKNNQISKDSEFYKYFNQYIGNPVKYQIFEKAGSRVCSKVKRFLQNLRMQFSISARKKFEKEEDTRRFFIKMDKTCNIYNGNIVQNNGRKLDLSDSIVEQPPTIGVQNSQREINRDINSR